jgi:formate hydrogenlyase transcriptional activator
VLYAFDRLKEREAQSQQRRQAAEDTVSVLAEEISTRHQADRIIGESQPLRHLLEQAERIAGTAGTVLILGETGTGKELFARAIHELSPRHARPLICINSAAIPESLVESELFGHERGAFTGASTQRKGRIELADGGTLFLDEVGDMPLAVQSKLLRVLQERELERVGGHTTIRVDVRVIAATHRNLQQLVREGSFREDLYYRLNVVPIHVPPLRERREDIPTLAKFFVNRFNTRHGRQVQRIAQSDIDMLAAYDWPGNVRELENIIERAVILSRGAMLELPELLAAQRPGREMPGASPGREAAGALPALATLVPPAAAFSGTVNELQHDYILQVLECTRWVIEGEAGAAARLGLKPSTLRNRMNRLGIHKVSRQRGE